MWAGLSSHPVNTHVSGTNVNLTFVAQAYALPNNGSANLQVSLDSFTVTSSSGTPGLNWVWPGQSYPVPLPSESIPIRIASNVVAHHDILEFQVNAHFTVTSPTASYPYQLSKKVTLVACNRGLSFATRKYADGTTSSPWPNNTTVADSYSAPSQSFKTSADAIPLLKSSKFHHYMDPTTATSEELLKNRNDILFGNVSNPAKLKVNNLLWILVHGSENGIYDSYHPAVDPAAGLMTNSEIVLAALANRTKPVFNFIALYNCKSFEATFWA